MTISKSKNDVTSKIGCVSDLCLQTISWRRIGSQLTAWTITWSTNHR